jgi:hypothetical protein
MNKDKGIKKPVAIATGLYHYLKNYFKIFKDSDA